MKKTYLTISVLLIILCSSCYSYKIHPKEYRKLENNNPKPNAYIINDTLTEEFEILASSRLFEIISDSTKADLKIKLYPMEENGICGQAFALSIFTIGQVPVVFAQKYFYTFDEIKSGEITKRKLNLEITRRVWFWDLFTFNKNFEKKASKAVLGDYLSSVYN